MQLIDEDPELRPMRLSPNDAKGKWMEELPHVLWTYRTTPRWLT